MTLSGPTHASSAVNFRRSSASRTQPTGPGHGRSPGPHGGTPRERRYGRKAQNDAQGNPLASATAYAPQQFGSTIRTSGRTSSIASVRSGISYRARRANTSITFDNASSGVRGARVIQGHGLDAGIDWRSVETHADAGFDTGGKGTQRDVVSAVAQLRQQHADREEVTHRRSLVRENFRHGKAFHD